MTKYVAKIIKPTAAAYMAGIVDGEGSLCIGTYAKTKSGKPMWAVTLGICSTDEPLIDWLVDNFGGAKLQYTSRQLAKNARKRVYRWQCTGDRLRHICELILPYSTIKRRQIEIMIEMLDTLTQKTYAMGQRGPTVSQAIIDRRFVLMDEIRAIHNRRTI